MNHERSVWIDAPGQLAVRPTEPAQLAPGDALVRVAWSGICGSDREMLNGTRPAPYVRYPVVPGHEWSGTVEAVGDGVDQALVGAPVVGEGIRPCRTCAACRRGDSNLCEGPYEETGFTLPGAWSNHLVVPANLLHRLPDDVDLRSAAGLEPAGCVASACLKLAVQPGERCAVIGGGMLGLLAVQLLRAGGAAEITLVHTNPDRAKLAEQCGATTLVTPDRASALQGRFDAVLEAAGAPGTASLAALLTRRGGRLALTGIAARETQPIDPAALVLNELTVHTVFGASPRAWTHAVRALASGALNPGILVTHEVPLDEVSEAFRILEQERHKAVKVLLVP